MTNKLILLFTILTLGLMLLAEESDARQADDGIIRIIAFGDHPDDCDICSGGVAAMWAAQGHAFKCVSMTNGDIGHFGMSGGELALRRMQEVQNAADVLGITTNVFDIHDGEDRTSTRLNSSHVAN